jgi:hypothetical protein
MNLNKKMTMMYKKVSRWIVKQISMILKLIWSTINSLQDREVSRLKLKIDLTMRAEVQAKINQSNSKKGM